MERNMKLRIATGFVYFAVLVTFFVLKIVFNSAYFGAKHYGNLCFDALILAFGVFGTHEMLNVFKDKLHVTQKIVVMLFSLATIVVYAITDFVYTDVYGVQFPNPEHPLEAVGRNYAPYFMLVVYMTGIAVLFGLLVFAHSKVDLESTGCSLIAYVYPTVFLIVLIVCNHLEKYSDVAIALVFGISPCVDCMAFAFGKSFGKKLPAKMAPHISPNKTVIGGFGGLLGGALGAIIVFFVYYGVCIPIAIWDFSNVSFRWIELVFYVAIGIVTSAFSQFGDLVESAIKRKLGIKDMGKLLPGHGGILDRIDSSLYAGLIIALIFVVRLMTFG